MKKWWRGARANDGKEGNGKMEMGNAEGEVYLAPINLLFARARVQRTGFIWTQGSWGWKWSRVYGVDEARKSDGVTE